MEKKKILVVVDVQNDFIDGALRNEDAIKTVPNIVKKINEFDGDLILVTMDTHGEDYLETKEGINLPVKHCIKGTSGWKMNEDVKNAIMDAKLDRDIKVIVFEKPTFGSKYLSKFLAHDSEVHGENGEDLELNIEFVGFCTDICVVSNALMVKAAVYDHANVSVVENCCAGVTPETHNAAISTMKMCQINII